jgi:hypothetical protein
MDYQAMNEASCSSASHEDKFGCAKSNGAYWFLVYTMGVGSSMQTFGFSELGFQNENWRYQAWRKNHVGN